MDSAFSRKVKGWHLILSRQRLRTANDSRLKTLKFCNYLEVADSIPNGEGRPSPRNQLDARHGLGRPTGEWAGVL